MSGTKKYCVYKHTNKTNGLVYIGITCQKPNSRWRSGKGYKDNSYFTNAINKYGWDGFEHLILVRGLTEEEAKWLEIQLIAAYDSTNRGKGYNISTGGESGSGCKCTEERKKQISESMKGENNPNYGKHHSEETRRKISENHADMKGNNNPMYGKHHTEESKKRMSESKRGKNSSNSKIIICLTTGCCFYGCGEASRITGVVSQNISEACKGKRKSAGKLPDGTKLRWAYVKDLPKPKLTQEQKQYMREITRDFKKSA